MSAARIGPKTLPLGIAINVHAPTREIAEAYAQSHVVIKVADLERIKAWAKRRGVYRGLRALRVMVEPIEITGQPRSDGDAPSTRARKKNRASGKP